MSNNRFSTAVLVAFSTLKGGSGTGISNFKSLLDEIFATVLLKTTDNETGSLGKANALISKVMHATFNICFLNREYRTANIYSRIKVVDRGVPIFLGWIGNNTVTIKQLMELSSPIFLRLSDEWMYNGFIHYGEIEKNYFASAYRQKKNAFLQQDNVFIICPSLWIKNRLLEQAKISEDKVLFLPNAINEFWKEKCDKEVRSGLLFISGNLDEKRKRVDLLIDLISNYRIRQSCHVVGKGLVSRKLVQLNCTLYGQLRSTELRNVMRTTKFVLSLTDTDNSPNAVIESILQGNVPIVKGGSGITSYVPPEFHRLLTFTHVNEIPEIILSVDSKVSLIRERCREYILELTEREKLSKDLQQFIIEKLK